MGHFFHLCSFSLPLRRALEEGKKWKKFYITLINFKHFFVFFFSFARSFFFLFNSRKEIFALFMFSSIEEKSFSWNGGKWQTFPLSSTVTKTLSFIHFACCQQISIWLKSFPPPLEYFHFINSVATLKLLSCLLRLKSHNDIQSRLVSRSSIARKDYLPDE